MNSRLHIGSQDGNLKNKGKHIKSKCQLNITIFKFSGFIHNLKCKIMQKNTDENSDE